MNQNLRETTILKRPEHKELTKVLYSWVFFLLEIAQRELAIIHDWELLSLHGYANESERYHKQRCRGYFFHHAAILRAVAHDCLSNLRPGVDPEAYSALNPEFKAKCSIGLCAAYQISDSFTWLSCPHLRVSLLHNESFSVPSDVSREGDPLFAYAFCARICARTS